MPRFEFQFAALLNYRRNRRDLCRQLLSQALADERELLGRRRLLEDSRGGQLDEIRNLVAAGQIDIDRAATRRYFAGRLLGEIGMVERNRSLLAQQLELCRTTLLQADREVKSLEKLEEKQRAEFIYQHERRMSHELHDNWQAARTSETLR